MTGDRADDAPSEDVQGLQAERTYLAWQRTGLAFAAAGALLVHAAGDVGRPEVYAPGAFGLAVGAAILLRALLRYRTSLAAASGERSAMAAGAVAAVALAATVMAVAGLVVVVLAR